jgi:restriction endonuclease Mrr
MMLAPDPRFVRIDQMNGLDFEEAVVELLEGLGYENVERTGYYDKGADATAVKDGVRTAIQVKRWASAVDEAAVMQLVNGVRQYECERGLLVTNSYLTERAAKTAETWGVEVWDRRTLSDFVEGSAPVVDTTVCAECGRQVSPGVTAWCLQHPGRYGGLVYCFPHQKRSQRRAG